MNQTNTSSAHLLHSLNNLGSYAELNFKLDCTRLTHELSAFEDQWKIYNPRKAGYNRQGLSITSLDGELSGKPDLDSILEYNKINKTQLGECDFKKLTPVYHQSDEIKKLIDYFSPHVGRSHLIRLNKGGFFPPHRDSIGAHPESFRVIVMGDQCSDLRMSFIVDDNLIKLRPGVAYFINTSLVHSLFSYQDGCEFIVLNLILCKESVDLILDRLTVT